MENVVSTFESVTTSQPFHHTIWWRNRVYSEFSVIEQRKLISTIFLYHLAYCTVSTMAWIRSWPQKNLTRYAQAFPSSIKCRS